jgi:hypothetical protein
MLVYDDDVLLLLATDDLERLLAEAPAQWPAHIVELNRRPYYHNRLNMITLLVRLAEVSASQPRHTDREDAA